jgi:hypothetical protein
MQGGGGLIVLAGPGDLQSDHYASAVPALSAPPKSAVPGDYMLA